MCRFKRRVRIFFESSMARCADCWGGEVCIDRPRLISVLVTQRHQISSIIAAPTHIECSNSADSKGTVYRTASVVRHNARACRGGGGMYACIDTPPLSSASDHRGREDGESVNHHRRYSLELLKGCSSSTCRPRNWIDHSRLRQHLPRPDDKSSQEPTAQVCFVALRKKCNAPFAAYM